MWRTRRGRCLTVVIAAGLIVGCAESASPSEDGRDAHETVPAEGEGQVGIDWSEGLTQQEQLAEIEFVVSVMKKHFGEDIMAADNWTLEGFAGLKGNPRPSSRAEGHYYYEVRFNFSEVEAAQEMQDKALAVLDEIGLSPNGELPTAHDEDRRNPIYVVGGREHHGRIFVVQQRGADAEISAGFMTRHSEHESMHAAHEASWE